jgi:hypothetical protein
MRRQAGGAQSGDCLQLDCSTAAISADLRRQGVAVDKPRLRRLSPLGWDHINLTGDYVWSDSPAYDADGMRPLNSEAESLAA